MDPEVERAAREAIDRYGAGAIAMLVDEAEQADAIGDGHSAGIWREIAEAVEQIADNPKN